MSNTPYDRAAIAKAALKQVSPLIRKTLLEEPSFREEYSFKADFIISFDDFGVSVKRSELFDAIREILSGTPELTIADTENREWKLCNEAENGGSPTLVISYNEQRLVLRDFAVLSSDPAIRLCSLDELASDVNLSANAEESWRAVLSERPLKDDEVYEYRRDFRDTPVHVARSIRSEIQSGTSSVSSLVPSSRKYYDRLIGAYDGSASVNDYAGATGRHFFTELSAREQYEGFLFSLFLSSHAALTSEIDVGGLESEDLVRAFDFLEKQGDTISQLGAIDVGLRILPERPELEPYLIRLIEKIRDDDVDGSVRGLKLFSALFVLVDGELSRTRLMPAEPPFYRRLASLTQAALIHRQLLNSGVDNTFCEWAFNNRGEQFYWQSLADMRLEPRWNPDMASAGQMKEDFFGRIMIAATNNVKNIDGRELHTLTLGTEPGSLPSLSKFPYPYFPGPLEGAEDSPNVLPDDLSKTIEEQLKTDEVGPSSFIALVNSARIFRVDSNQAELAAKALKLANYRLSKIEDKSQLFGILNGLATVAAAARSTALADELRILVLRYRLDVQHGFSIEEAMRICLVASSSREDLNEWREFAGDWLTELAFGELEGDDGEVFNSHLYCLLHAVPELWVSCAKADAALKAFCAR